MSKQTKPQSRMFRSIVLMGGGLALSCGGVAQESGGSNPASGGSGSAGAPSTTGTAGNGSIEVGGVGGATSTGGSGIAGSDIIIVSGAGALAGSGGAPSVSVPPPTDCAPSQWVCSSPQGCSDETGWLPTNCTCDLTRPQSPASCATGEVFTCLSTSYASDTPYGIDCSCIPAVTDGCTCRAAFGYQFEFQCDASADTTLCGCSFVLLK